jgi:hypothetical protein
LYVFAFSFGWWYLMTMRRLLSVATEIIPICLGVSRSFCCPASLRVNPCYLRGFARGSFARFCTAGATATFIQFHHSHVVVE